MKTWVSGHLTGGVGNRLFQHAAAAGLAEKWSRQLVFYEPDCEPTNHGPFHTIYKLFPSVPVIKDSIPFQRLPEPPNGVFTYFPFPNEPVSSCVTIDGWRQTERYFPTKGLHPSFESALHSTRREALLNEYNLQSTEERLETWFLHIRLGDYKLLPHHQIDLGSYYSQAIQYIPKGKRVFLFCDELEQYGQTLQAFFRQMGLEVLLAPIPDELETLYVMSLCWGGAVVANSTFSWWGAYFAKQTSPNPYTAIYPGKWGNGLPEARDIVPSWGIRIQNQ